MRSIVLLLIVVVGFSSCSKDDNDSPKKEVDYKNEYVTLQTINWRTTKETNTNGITEGLSLLGVHLQLVGTTLGDSIQLKTMGDGLIGYSTLKLDSKKAFNADVQISFSVVSPNQVPTTSFKATTDLLIFIKKDTLVVPLTSGLLKY